MFFGQSVDAAFGWKAFPTQALAHQCSASIIVRGNSMSLTTVSVTRDIENIQVNLLM